MKHTKIELSNGAGGDVLDISTVLENFLKRSFIDVKNNEGYTYLWPHQITFELTLISVNSLDAKRWKRGKIHGTLVVMW